jgi:hypothetical protein
MVKSVKGSSMPIKTRQRWIHGLLVESASSLPEALPWTRAAKRARRIARFERAQSYELA